VKAGPIDPWESIEHGPTRRNQPLTLPPLPLTVMIHFRKDPIAKRVSLRLRLVNLV